MHGIQFLSFLGMSFIEIPQNIATVQPDIAIVITIRINTLVPINPATPLSDAQPQVPDLSRPDCIALQDAVMVCIEPLMPLSPFHC